MKGILEVDLPVDHRQRTNRAEAIRPDVDARRFDVDHHVAAAIVRAPHVLIGQLAPGGEQLLLSGGQRRASAFPGHRTVWNTRPWSDLIIEFQARLQLARLSESFFENPPFNFVQFVRSDQIVTGAPVFLLKMLVPQAQQLDEIETFEARGHVLWRNIHQGAGAFDASDRVRRLDLTRQRKNPCCVGEQADAVLFEVDGSRDARDRRQSRSHVSSPAAATR
jgi:hypothetical protein